MGVAAQLQVNVVARSGICHAGLVGQQHNGVGTPVFAPRGGYFADGRGFYTGAANHGIVQAYQAELFAHTSLEGNTHIFASAVNELYPQCFQVA